MRTKWIFVSPKFPKALAVRACGRETLFNSYLLHVFFGIFKNSSAPNYLEFRKLLCPLGTEGLMTWSAPVFFIYIMKRGNLSNRRHVWFRFLNDVKSVSGHFGRGHSGRGHYGRGHLGRKRSLVILVAVITVPVISVVVIFVCILDTNLMLIYDRQIIINYWDECTSILRCIKI